MGRGANIEWICKLPAEYVHIADGAEVTGYTAAWLGHSEARGYVSSSSAPTKEGRVHEMGSRRQWVCIVLLVHAWIRNVCAHSNLVTHQLLQKATGLWPPVGVSNTFFDEVNALPSAVASCGVAVSIAIETKLP